MSRRHEVVTVAEWQELTSQLDGDLQLALAVYLGQWMLKPFVEHTTDSLGRIDTDSDPAYVDGPTD